MNKSGRLLSVTSLAMMIGLVSAPNVAADVERSEPFHLQVNMFQTEVPKSALSPAPGTVRDLLPAAGTAKELSITSVARSMPAKSDYVEVELYIENLHNYPLDQVTLHLDEAGGGAPVYDLTTNFYNRQALVSPYRVTVGHLAANAVRRLTIGVKKSFAPELIGTVNFVRGHGEGQTSTNILVTPAADELWAVSTETNEVVVTDLTSKRELARIPVGSRPTGLALQQAKDWLIVSSAGANTVTVIDRKAKRILSVLGTGDTFGRELRYVLVSQQKPTVYVSSYVEGLLTQINLNDQAQATAVKTISVGPRPAGMSMTADESTIYIAHFLPRGDIRNNEGWVSVAKTVNFNKAGEKIIEDIFNPGHPGLKCLADFYNNYGPTKLIYGKLDPVDFSLEGASSQLAGVFLDPSGQTAWIPGTRITGALVVLERGPNAQKGLTRFGSQFPAQLVAPLLFPLDAGSGELKDIHTSDIEMAIPTLGPVVTCLRHPLEIEFIDRTVLNNGKEQINPLLAYGVPHAGLTGLGLINTIKFSRGGRRVFLLSQTSDEIAVYDGTTMEASSQFHFGLSGDNPKGMALTPDGKRAYVLYENSSYISELDMSAYSPADDNALPKPYAIPYRYSATTKGPPIQLGAVLGFPLIRDFSQLPKKPLIRELGQISLRTNDPMEKDLRRGKILFETANPDKYPVSVNRLGACASCHPDGGGDGSSWVTMEGPRRTLGLRGGVGQRGWLHGSATHANGQEFVERIVPERLGGKLPQEDYDAMAKYLNVGIAKLQNPRVDLAMAARGQQTFKTNCAGCHNSPTYGSGVNADGSPQLFNIGTTNLDHGVASGKFATKLVGLADPASAQIAEALIGDRELGPDDPLQKILDFSPRPVRAPGQLKVPSLEGSFDNVLFFHDGSVTSLKGAIEKINQLLRLGLSDNAIADLEQYIKSL